MNNRFRNFIKKKFDKPKTGLDLGYGKGADMNWLKDNKWKMSGVEKKEYDLNNVFVSGKSYDLVYANFVIQFIWNKKNFVETCYKNLKKNGLIYIETFSSNDPVARYRSLEKDELKELFLLFPFKNIKIKEIKAKKEDEHGHKHAILILTAQK